MSRVSVPAPAKLNLFLAVTGRRPDGFHDLVSVVSPLEFGDELVAETDTRQAHADNPFTLDCSDPEVPLDGSNLVLTAARAFAAATGWRERVAFKLEKRIPMGAGLGGGSSDAVAALRALNRLAGEPLQRPALILLAAQLGSDCPLFLEDGPIVMRGRGDRIEPLADAGRRRLEGRQVIVFKPPFGISTIWAYRRMADLHRARIQAGGLSPYLAPQIAEQRLTRWIADPAVSATDLLFNNLELPAFEKHIALPVLLHDLESRFGLAPRMTGSGSACFAFLPDQAPEAEITTYIRSAWGESSLVLVTRLAKTH